MYIGSTTTRLIQGQFSKKNVIKISNSKIWKHTVLSLATLTAVKKNIELYFFIIKVKMCGLILSLPLMKSLRKLCDPGNNLNFNMYFELFSCGEDHSVTNFSSKFDTKTIKITIMTNDQ